MTKILLVTYYFPPKIGGGEEYLYNIYKRLSADKVVVLAHGKPCDFDAKQNFKIYRANFFTGKFKPTWRPLVKTVKQIIKKQGIEIIHFGHYAHYALLARILKVPYLVYFQGSDFTSYSSSWFGKWLMKLNLNKAKKIITNSYYLKNKIIKLGIKDSKIEVLRPGLNIEEYNIKSETSRFDSPNYHSSTNPKIVLSVGRLNYAKGFDLVIRALPKIIKKIPRAIYVIVGDGEEKENLKRLVGKLNLANKVVFAGEIKNKKELSKYYMSADVYAGPSRSEGFGIVFLEARSFGLPIVASNVGGIHEAVENGGVLIKSENLKELTQAIIQKLKSSQKYRPDRNFDWENKMEKIKKILLQI